VALVRDVADRRGHVGAPGELGPRARQLVFAPGVDH
jgi:hypothetical protein